MTDERAMRFGYLLSEIEMDCRKILDGSADDIPMTVEFMHVAMTEAREIAREVSREALDKVVNEEPVTISEKDDWPPELLK